MATSNGPVEKKVTASSAAALITSAIVVYILSKVPALQAWNDLLQTVVGAVVIAAVTWVVGFWTKHTSRNDVGTRKTGTSDPIPPTG